MSLTILLVDDDPLMHRMLVPRLEAMKTRVPVTRVLAAQTPDAALAVLEDIPAGPLAVVSDFNLKAAMNGLQLLRNVRKKRPDALRFLLSGYSLQQLGDVQDGGDAHAFLEKPLMLDELIRPLARLIDERLPG
jgi:CheY-like chemotaxis protein